MEKVKVIAEIANAHQGDPRILRQLVSEAALAGADGIKFQWFKYDHLATSDYAFFQIYKELFIPEYIWEEIIFYAKDMGLEVWIDIFDDWGVALANQLNSFIDGYKIPATVIQSETIARDILSFKKPVLLGIGGWYEQEIEQFITNLDLEHLSNLVLIHGYQGYPTNTRNANLVRISFLKDRFSLPVGFADHEDGENLIAIYLPIYAVFAGAVLIEKHLTLDRSKKGYDYYSALEPPEFSKMVSELRKAELALGTRNITESERSYLKDSLRIVAKRAIQRGEVLTYSNVVSKRCPAEDALMPWQFAECFPSIAKDNLQQDQPLLLENLEPPRITIAVVCRLKSTRLTKKALRLIHGIPSIERCLHNCLAVRNVQQVVLATSHLAEDDSLEEFTLNDKVKIVRGDPDNVASRLIQAAEVTGANIILRVTGDCPVVSPEVLEILIEHHLKNGPDLTLPTSGHALGIAGDVYTVQSLYKLLEQSNTLTHTEYLSFYFLQNPDLFSVETIDLPESFRIPQWRLTLDEQKDLELLDKIYAALNIQDEPLFFNFLLPYLMANPHLTTINADVSLKWRDNVQLKDEILQAVKLNSPN